MTSQPADKPTHPAWRTRTLSALTALAHGSAPFITTFLFVHLAAPAAANLGGSSASSRTMLFGREYYQTVLGERYLVFTPLLVHTTSAFLKRLFSSSSTSTPRPLTSALSVTGYATALFLLPVHFYAHRLAPSDPAPPISSLGPSELDYEYVKAALHGWPTRSSALYLALVLGVALHAADGVGVLWSSTTWVQKKVKKLLPRGRRRRARRALAGAAVLPVLAGLAIIAREPRFAFASMTERYRAALTRSFVYRLY